MAGDFRSDPMESPEGKGNAKRAWEAYLRTTGKVAAPLTKRLAATMNAELWGFWLIWHLCGGFEGLQRLGFSRSGIYRRIKRFRQVTGYHPDEFEMPGVTIDPTAYWAAPASEVFRSPGT